MRLDRWIRDRYPGLTQSQAREIFERGWVRDGRGRALAKGEAVPPDVDVSVWDTRLAELRAANRALELDVLAENPHFWVVDKPSGFPGHPLGVDDVHTATQWAFANGADAREFPEPIATLTPHRLDIGTSGCLVVAKTRDAFERWREAFSSHGNEKTYLAWTWGSAGANACVVRHAIGPVLGDPTRRKAVGEGARGEGIYPAETALEPLHRTATMTLWRARCRTGVTHQIRVHLASIGFPLVGDALYDPDCGARALRPPHHWLRAVRLDGPLGNFRAPEEKFVALPESFCA